MEDAPPAAYSEEPDEEPVVEPETEPEPEVVVYRPSEGQDYRRDKKGRRLFEHWSPEGMSYIAVDDRDVPFTDENGNYIFVTSKGIAEADRVGVQGWARRLANLARTGGASTGPLPDDMPQLYDENGAPVEHFVVPPLGRSATVSQRMTGGRRLAIFVASAVVLASGFGSCGVMWGRSAVPASGVISATEANTYRLSDMPVTAMAAFGQQYLNLCLTHGYEGQVESRAQLLASMSTGGGADDCGWSKGGKVQQPQSIAYTGRWRSIEGFDGGRAAVLDFNVSMDGLAYFTVSVPIWVDDPTSSNNMSVVGDIGIGPGMRMTKPEGFTRDLYQDPSLANTVQEELLQPFFQAWSASDAKQIALTAAHDAGPEVRTGLRGLFTNPTILKTEVLTSYNTSQGDVVVYADGDRVEAIVTVDWEVPASQSTQTASYQVELRRTSGKWEVLNIRSGAVGSQAADPNRKEQTSAGINRVDAGLSPTGGAASDTTDDSEDESASESESAPATTESTEASESPSP
ncbi:conjugal transfer protein [Gordonia alkanivorans]|uniref:conjugal transfer protein n=1 Tax=Gordonia alkanivorans TaxID=84096 RepID=UPI0005A8C78C|nr:conjugal transfer protein [Gordonia alkanivorans]